MNTTVYDLDGIYFRVERDGKWQSLCVSDLTLEELKSVTKDWDCNQLTIVAKELSCTLKGLFNYPSVHSDKASLLRAIADISSVMRGIARRGMIVQRVDFSILFLFFCVDIA